MHTLISIIVPAHNTENYISKCLDSIIAQTFTDWEAIIVDDGSKDNTGTICDEYAKNDNRFIVIHQENQGVVAARNNAIAFAKGEYLAFVDSDDYIAPTMLEEMHALAEKQELDITWCSLYEVHNGYITEERVMIEEDNENNIRKLLTSKLSGYLWNKLTRREFWNNCNIKTDREAVICEDTYISVQLLANNPKMGIIDKCFYYYVKYNSNSATASQRLPITVRAEKNIANIYSFLEEKQLLGNHYEEFCSLALRLKIEMLPFDSKKAVRIFPFAHKKLRRYKFQFIISCYYWLIFNTGFIGQALIRLKKW